jgi:tetratricopeptide (TPR) repeat protein
MLIFDYLNYLFYPDKAAHDDLNRALKSILDEKHADAIARLTRAIHLRPEDAYLYANRAVAFAHIVEYDAAIRDFTTALKRGVHDPALIYANRGATYDRNGKLEEAIADYGEALRLGLDLERAVSILRARGHSLIAKGDLKRAEANYQAILDLDSSAWDIAYLGFGLIKLELKDYEGATENFQKQFRSTQKRNTIIKIARLPLLNSAIGNMRWLI